MNNYKKDLRNYKILKKILNNLFKKNIINNLKMNKSQTYFKMKFFKTK